VILFGFEKRNGVFERKEENELKNFKATSILIPSKLLFLVENQLIASIKISLLKLTSVS